MGLCARADRCICVSYDGIKSKSHHRAHTCTISSVEETQTLDDTIQSINETNNNKILDELIEHLVVKVTPFDRQNLRTH